MLLEKILNLECLQNSKSLFLKTLNVCKWKVLGHNYKSVCWGYMNNNNILINILIKESMSIVILIIINQ